jgi:hypothetical protein
MKSIILLRIASVLTMIHCVLHTIGGVLGKPMHGIDEIAVVDKMKCHAFNVMGSMRTYWDFFFGYGLGLTVTLFVQAILFWMLGSYVKTNPGLVRAVALLFCVDYALMAVVVGRYFFVAPAVFEALIAACLLTAYFRTAAA